MADKAILLDRDDTLIKDPGFINKPEQVKLIDGVAEALVELKEMGYKLVVVSNQSGVARGIVSEKVLGEIHNRLKQLLAEKGAGLDGIYYCPYHPDGTVAKYSKESDWRKPNPGMLLAAAEEMGLDLGQCWAIGNSGRDVEAGSRAGCKTILIDSPSRNIQSEMIGVKPDYRAINMKEVVNIIKQHHRSGDKSEVEAPSAPGKRVNKSSLQVESDENKNESGGNVERLLHGISEQLRRMHREDMFSEFSIMKLMGHVVQVVAVFCLLIGIWILLSPAREGNSVLVALGFAVALQLMALTFYMMQGRQ